jgi:transcription initiation factor TFIID subunit 11
MDRRPLRHLLLDWKQLPKRQVEADLSMSTTAPAEAKKEPEALMIGNAHDTVAVDVTPNRKPKSATKRKRSAATLPAAGEDNDGDEIRTAPGQSDKNKAGPAKKKVKKKEGENGGLGQGADCSGPATAWTEKRDGDAVAATGLEGAEGDREKGDGEGLGDDDEADEVDLAAMRQHEHEQVARFGPTQLQRYEQYRRSDLKKEKIKKVLTAINPILAKSSDPFLIAVKGLAKVFVGDVVETALEIRRQYGESGPLQTKHLREAYRRLRQDGVMPTTDIRPGGFG